MNNSSFGLPPSAGQGLKTEHFREVFGAQPDIGFFEVRAENHMVAGGPFHHYLKLIREQYPLSLHGVGLSVFLVEQNANQSLKIADRAYVLENGRGVMTGTGEALLTDPKVREAYLGG